jgi:hypothetical protein
VVHRGAAPPVRGSDYGVAVWPYVDVLGRIG